MTTTDFKPCPFCGNDYLNLYVMSAGVGETVRHVKCSDCYASAPAAVWNQRSPMAEVQEIMEGLKK